MKIFIYCFLLIFSGCSRFKARGQRQEGKTLYSYTDVSGKFNLSREQKLLNQKLITRTQLSSSDTGKPLEKSIMVSQLGSIQDKGARLVVLRPEASEFTIWLEGKKYSSVMKLDTKKKAMHLDLDSPEEKWKGSQTVPFPSGRAFCFYNQIPDCLYHNQFLKLAMERKNKTFSFVVIWDNYPYVQDLLTGVGGQLFSRADLRYEGKYEKLERFVVDVEGQQILYQFSNSLDLIKMSWVSQGITVVPPGQEAVTEEE